MKRNHPRSLGQRMGRTRRGWFAVLTAVLVLMLASPAAADEYDPGNAGHPVRIVAYLLYPVGMLIDYVLIRPAHWIVSSEPMKTIFGHKD